MTNVKFGPVTVDDRNNDGIFQEKSERCLEKTGKPLKESSPELSKLKNRLDEMNRQWLLSRD